MTGPSDPHLAIRRHPAHEKAYRPVPYPRVRDSTASACDGWRPVSVAAPGITVEVDRGAVT